MAITINGEVKRNAVEQIQKNKDDIEELQGSITTPKFEDIQGDIYDNTSAANALNNKVDKETGKGLSTNDYTTAEKTKLAGIDMSTKQDVLTTKQMAAVDSGITKETFDDVCEVANEVFDREFKVESDTPLTLTVVRDATTKKTHLAVVGGSGVWGAITGNINSQTDLMTELNKYLLKSVITQYRTSADQDTIDASLLGSINAEKGRAEGIEQTLNTAIQERLLSSDLVAGTGIVLEIDGRKVTIRANSTAMTYQGNVTNYEDLPSTARAGDVYGVTSHGVLYCRTAGGTWANIGAIISPGNFYTKSEADDLFIKQLGDEPYSHAPYNIPFHFADLRFDTSDNKIKSTLHTITLDNNKTRLQWPMEVQLPLSNYIPKLGDEPYSHGPYNFPFHSVFKFEDNKIKGDIYTITLDGNKERRIWPMEISLPFADYALCTDLQDEVEERESGDLALGVRIDESIASEREDVDELAEAITTVDNRFDNYYDKTTSDTRYAPAEDVVVTKYDSTVASGTNRAALMSYFSGTRGKIVFPELVFGSADSPDGTQTSIWQVELIKKGNGYACMVAKHLVKNSATGNGDLYTCSAYNGTWGSWSKVITSAGGTITGNLTLNGNLISGTDACIVRSDNTHEAWLIGGTNYQNGSFFRASGKDSTLGGKFQCVARNSSTTMTLEGSPDGTLKWNGSAVLTAATGYTQSQINTKLTDGSVTKIGTATKGSATQPIYLNAGVPTACNAYSLGTWSNVAWSGSSGVVFAPASGFTFSTASGHSNKYRTDTLGRIEVSLRTTITTSNSIAANSFTQIGTLNKKNGTMDVWVVATVLVGGKYYALPFHITDGGAVYLSNTTSSALSLSGAQLQVTFFTA